MIRREHRLPRPPRQISTAFGESTGAPSSSAPPRRHRGPSLRREWPRQPLNRDFTVSRASRLSFGQGPRRPDTSYRIAHGLQPPKSSTRSAPASEPFHAMRSASRRCMAAAASPTTTAHESQKPWTIYRRRRNRPQVPTNPYIKLYRYSQALGENPSPAPHTSSRPQI